MQIPIVRVSRYAVSCIEGTHAGTVHSVYRRTINLQLEPSGPGQNSNSSPDAGSSAGYTAGAAHPQLIALQDQDCVLSPLSLCTSLSADRLSSLPVWEGQSVLVDRGGVLIVTPDEMIEFEITDSTTAADLNLSAHPALPLTAESLAALAVNISYILPLSPPGSFARIYCDPGHNNSLILDAAARCVSKAAAQLRAGETASAAETLCEGLTGLGPGLTPGGDDFLCGVLAGLFLRGAFADSGSRLSAFARALRVAITDHLSDTIDISAAFLHCACEGQFSEAVIRLAEDTAAGRADSRSIADTFSEIGHTSGFDTLAGIFFSLANP